MEDLTKVIVVNLSNHTSDKWSYEQRDALFGIATGYSRNIDFQIIDIPFPSVSYNADTEKVIEIGKKILQQIGKWGFKYIIIQGELTLTYFLVNEFLKLNKIPIIATRKRVTIKKENGEKISVFKFVRFRRYYDGGVR